MNCIDEGIKAYNSGIPWTRYPINTEEHTTWWDGWEATKAADKIPRNYLATMTIDGVTQFAISLAHYTKYFEEGMDYVITNKLRQKYIQQGGFTKEIVLAYDLTVIVGKDAKMIYGNFNPLDGAISPYAKGTMENFAWEDGIVKGSKAWTEEEVTQTGSFTLGYDSKLRRNHKEYHKFVKMLPAQPPVVPVELVKIRRGV